MHRVIILGAGKIGSAIAKLLHYSHSYDVLVADTHPHTLEQLSTVIPVKTAVIDVTDEESLIPYLQNCDSVISACPYWVNSNIATAALKAGVSYFDLTEDVKTTQEIRAIAQAAKWGQIFMPQCGLAPGFIGILAHYLSLQFDELEEVKMRVGALPLFPSNLLKYNLTWSTDGLINQYCNPCETIRNGRRTEVMPLEGLEHFSLDGIEYEAFNTSGGLGTLCETLEGKVRHLNYKTVRYKGHQYLISFLLKDLGLADQREILRALLEKAIPVTKQDVVLILSTVTGYKNGQFLQVTDARKIYHTKIEGEDWSGLQLSTAAGLCAVLDLHGAGLLPKQGFIKQEQVNFDSFINNRFGQYYLSINQPLPQPEMCLV